METTATAANPNPNQSSRPPAGKRNDTCGACKGQRVLFKPVVYYGELACVYSHGSRAKDVMIPCPRCGDADHKAKVAQRSNLEPRERDVLLTDFQVPTFPDHPGWAAQRRKAKVEIGNALRSKHGLYTFWGSFGSGKTMSAWVIVNEMREMYGTEGFFAPFASILDTLRQMWGHKEDTGHYWQHLLDVPVLAVDEVTRFNETKDWEREKLFVLVDTRYRRRDSHLTVFTTNENPFRNVANEDIGYLFSRMREGTLVELRGDVRGLVGG